MPSTEGVTVTIFLTGHKRVIIIRSCESVPIRAAHYGGGLTLQVIVCVLLSKTNKHGWIWLSDLVHEFKRSDLF